MVSCQREQHRLTGRRGRHALDRQRATDRVAGGHGVADESAQRTLGLGDDAAGGDVRVDDGRAVDDGDRERPDRHGLRRRIDGDATARCSRRAGTARRNAADSRPAAARPPPWWHPRRSRAARPRRWWRRRHSPPGSCSTRRRGARRSRSRPAARATDSSRASRRPPANRPPVRSVSWCQPGVMSSSAICQSPLSEARVVQTRSPSWMFTSAPGSAHPAPGESAQLDAPEHQPGHRGQRAGADRQAERRWRQRHRDAAPRRRGDAGEGAIVGVDLCLRRVRGRRRRLEEVQQMLPERQRRDQGLERERSVGERRRVHRHQRLDQAQRQAPQLLGDDEAAKAVLRVRDRPARDELAGIHDRCNRRARPNAGTRRWEAGSRR